MLSCLQKAATSEANFTLGKYPKGKNDSYTVCHKQIDLLGLGQVCCYFNTFYVRKTAG